MLPPRMLRPEGVLAGWSESPASYGALGVLHADRGELLSSQQTIADQ